MSPKTVANLQIVILEKEGRKDIKCDTQKFLSMVIKIICYTGTKFFINFMKAPLGELIAWIKI